jgi:hypothetical protein
MTRPNSLEIQQLLAALFDLASWFRGDMRIGVLKVQSITAGNGSTFFIQPPDDNEEWELLYASLTDTAAIDVLDVTHFAYVDQILNQVIEMQQGTLQAGVGSLAGQNIVTFPNRDVSKPQVSILDRASYGLICKTKGAQGWMALRAQYSATATVGTRLVTPIFAYLRRRLK